MSSVWKPIPPPFITHKKEVFAQASLVSDFIYQIGESHLLRLPSKEVLIDKNNMRELLAKIRYLKACLRKYRKLTGRGRGIAGVQVGIPERFAVVYTSEKLITFINPLVTKKSKKNLKYPEMCMSACPIIAPLIRPSWIEFSYYDEGGVLNVWDTKDDTDQGRILNRVFQHEIDHMRGIINIDIVGSPKELILESDPEYYKTAKFEEV